ncbi:hypothetical protein F4860DRAFT_529123 [Xylaria cubensis]|nr:hypothetical protein F4860DRAFT_529123 [Xylaria cubensis]
MMEETTMKAASATVASNPSEIICVGRNTTIDMEMEATANSSQSPSMNSLPNKLERINSKAFETQLKAWTASNIQVARGLDVPKISGDNIRFQPPSDTEVPNENWERLWKWSLLLFQSCPSDLFSWGLRLTGGHPSENRSVHQSLCLLLPHPVWQGQLSRLRYALQTAVCSRFKDHIPPVGPLSGEIVAGLLSLYTEDNRVDVANLALQWWRDIGYDNDSAMLHLSEKISELAPNGASIPEQPHDKRVFHLHAGDVQRVISALDLLHEAGAFSHRVLTYYNHFVCRTEAELDTFPPTNRQCLKHWDDMLAFNKDMDAIRGLPDIPRAEQDVYQKIGYWNSPKCDNQVRKALLDDYHELSRSNRKLRCFKPSGTNSPFKLGDTSSPNVTASDQRQNLAITTPEIATKTHSSLALVCIDGFCLPAESDDEARQLITTPAPAMMLTLVKIMMTGGFTPPRKCQFLFDLARGQFGTNVESDRKIARELYAHIYPFRTAPRHFSDEELSFYSCLTRLAYQGCVPLLCLQFCDGTAEFVSLNRAIWDSENRLLHCEQFSHGPITFSTTPSHFCLFWRVYSKTCYKYFDILRRVVGKDLTRGCKEVLYNLVAAVEFPPFKEDPERFWLFDADGHNINSGSMPESMQDFFPLIPLSDLHLKNLCCFEYMFVYQERHLGEQETVQPREVSSATSPISTQEATPTPSIGMKRPRDAYDPSSPECPETPPERYSSLKDPCLTN